MTRNIWEEIIEHGAYIQELDWVAIDRIGNVGVFSAIMLAPIPNKVKASYENYITLKQAIDLLPVSTSSILVTVEDGDFSNWTAYAEKGLFAFDFQDAHRDIAKKQYDLIAKPLSPINIANVNIPSNLFETIVSFDCNFSDGDLPTQMIK